MSPFAETAWGEFRQALGQANDARLAVQAQINRRAALLIALGRADAIQWRVRERATEERSERMSERVGDLVSERATE